MTSTTVKAHPRRSTQAREHDSTPLKKPCRLAFLATEPLENIILKLKILRHAARPLQLLQRHPPSVPRGRERPAVSRLLLRNETGPSLGGRQLHQPHSQPAVTQRGGRLRVPCVLQLQDGRSIASKHPRIERPARHVAQVG